MLAEQPDDWLYHFAIPDELAKRRLEHFITTLKLPYQSPQIVGEQEPTLEGAAKQVLEAVFARLRMDYEENRNETTESEYLFDYVVTSEAPNECCLHVMTRLFGSNRSGSIFYGRTIARVSESQYLAWIDE